jgi:hypothetical protein
MENSTVGNAVIIAYLLAFERLGVPPSKEPHPGSRGKTLFKQPGLGYVDIAAIHLT